VGRMRGHGGRHRAPDGANDSNAFQGYAD